MSVTSIVTPTPSTNGKAPSVLRTNRARARASTAPAPMTAAQACEAAYNYGVSLAGIDGDLTNAIKAFKDNESVMADMLASLNVGYYVRKLGYTKERATEVVGLLKYNPKKEDDHHRTFEQQRVMDTVRVVWHRAQKMAGVVKPKTDKQVAAEQTRAQKEADKAEHESRLIAADEIVNPKNDVDPFDALSRLVLTMKALQNKYSAKLTGERGSQWRAWLAKAPK